MKDLLMFIRRFARPYKWNVVWSVVFNFLTMFFTIFSFAFIMPILKILFKLDTTEYTYMQFGEVTSRMCLSIISTGMSPT